MRMDKALSAPQESGQEEDTSLRDLSNDTLQSHEMEEEKLWRVVSFLKFLQDLEMLPKSAVHREWLHFKDRQIMSK